MVRCGEGEAASRAVPVHVSGRWGDVAASAVFLGSRARRRNDRSGNRQMAVTVAVVGQSMMAPALLRAMVFRRQLCIPPSSLRPFMLPVWVCFGARSAGSSSRPSIACAVGLRRGSRHHHCTPQLGDCFYGRAAGAVQRRRQGVRASSQAPGLRSRPTTLSSAVDAGATACALPLSAWCERATHCDGSGSLMRSSPRRRHRAPYLTRSRPVI